MKQMLKKVLLTFGFSVSNGTVSGVRLPVNPEKRAKRIFSSALLKPTKWRHDDVSLVGLKASRYFDLWNKFQGGHKKYSYFSLYDELFSDLIGKSPKVLEIGVFNGASIKTWREFFGAGSVIVGVDLNPECAQYDDPDNNVHVRIGSQADEEFLTRVVQEFGPFDLIIDDGSHMTHHVIASFNILFDRGLDADGRYFAEDLNTSMWKHYRSSKDSSIDLFLSLAELMSTFYYRYGYEEYGRDMHPTDFEVLTYVR